MRFLTLSIAIMFCVGCESAPRAEHETEAAGHSDAETMPAAQAEKNVLRIAPDMLRDLRLTSVPAEARESGEGITALGELRVNEDAYAEVHAPTSARVAKILVGVGDVVSSGQPLVELRSSEVGEAIAEYLRDRARAQLADQALRRKRELAAERILPQRELQEAEAEAAAASAELEAAEAKLSALGVATDELRGAGNVNTDLVLRAPIAGTVLERNLVRGQIVDPATTLVRIAGLSKLWLVAHVFERDAVRVRTGATARPSFAALPGRTFTGTVALIGQQVDEGSRTIPVRIEVPNDGELRPGMSASAWIPLGETGGALVAVPTAALQRCVEGWCVFIPRGAGSFEVRAAGRGRDLGGEVEVVNGLAAGETVVVDGAFLLRAELERSKGKGEHHDH